ncbi:tetratricopeptide repeat protein [bacterium]|nr:tetratricopeptide repeat protein [bacterium]
MRKSSLGALAVLLAAGFACVRAPAEEEPAARVEAWLSALVADDPAPLSDALLSGLLPERVARRYHPTLSIDQTDPAGFRAGLAEGLSAALAQWARAWRDARFSLLATEVVSATETVVVARIENQRERQYLSFVFEQRDGAQRLADIRLPLLGTDLESMMVDAVTNRPAPKRRQAAVDLLVWTGRAACSAAVVVGIMLLVRAGGSRRRRAAGGTLLVLLGAGGLMLLSRATPRVSPEEQDIWLRRERIALITNYLSRGDWRQAEELARDFRARWPYRPRGLLFLSHALFAQRKYAEAEQLYHQMVAQNAYRELAHQQLARIAEASGEYARAAEHLRAVVAAMGPDPSLLVELAHDQLRSGAVLAASETLTQALEREPAHLLAREMRARAALRMSDPVAAASDLLELRRRDPRLAPATLRTDPEFAPLFSDPRFASLLEAAP